MSYTRMLRSWLAAARPGHRPCRPKCESGLLAAQRRGEPAGAGIDQAQHSLACPVTSHWPAVRVHQGSNAGGLPVQLAPRFAGERRADIPEPKRGVDAPGREDARVGRTRGSPRDLVPEAGASLTAGRRGPKGGRHLGVAGGEQRSITRHVQAERRRIVPGTLVQLGCAGEDGGHGRAGPTPAPSRPRLRGRPGPRGAKHATDVAWGSPKRATSRTEAARPTRSAGRPRHVPRRRDCWRARVSRRSVQSRNAGHTVAPSRHSAAPRHPGAVPAHRAGTDRAPGRAAPRSGPLEIAEAQPLASGTQVAGEDLATLGLTRPVDSLAPSPAASSRAEAISLKSR